MRVVIYHQGALGDFLLLLPVLEGMARLRPGFRADFWSKREHVSLLSGKDYLGDFYPLDGPLAAALLDDGRWEKFPLPDFILRADSIFIFGQEGARTIAQRLSGRLGGRAHWVRSFPGPGDSGVHAGDFIAKQVAALGWPHRQVFRALEPPLSEVSAARGVLERLGAGERPVVIHPGSGGMRKIWPLRCWTDLVERLRREFRVPVLLSEGPADECIAEFFREMGRAGTAVVRGLSTAGLSALLSLGRLFIGSDSGVSHLAAAVGTPALVLFGPTDPEVWAPRGDEVRIIRGSWNEKEVAARGPAEDCSPSASEVIAQAAELLG